VPSSINVNIRDGEARGDRRIRYKKSLQAVSGGQEKRLEGL